MTSTVRPTIFLGWLAFGIGCLVVTGCLRPQANEVVVYTALDREFSEPIFDDFTQKTGIRILAKYDTESTKTVGLTNALIAESNRPRCDVFWNNEILNTLRLEQRGLLAPFRPQREQEIPHKYRSPTGHWFGFAARARVLLVNTNLVTKAEFPKSVRATTDPKWKDRFAIAKPLFGTTATHAAVMFSHGIATAKASARTSDSSEQAKRYWQTTLQYGQVLSGNKQVARAVASGQVSWGMTDTDDAIIEIDNGYPVEMVFPDQEHEGDATSLPMGTPLIPNTVAIISGCPNRSQAERLINYLLSPEVETKLARGTSAQIPLLRSSKTPSRLPMPSSLRDMRVDYGAAAAKWDEAAAFLREKYIE